MDKILEFFKAEEKTWNNNDDAHFIYTFYFKTDLRDKMKIGRIGNYYKSE